MRRHWGLLVKQPNSYEVITRVLPEKAETHFHKLPQLGSRNAKIWTQTWLIPKAQTLPMLSDSPSIFPWLVQAQVAYSRPSLPVASHSVHIGQMGLVFEGRQTILPFYVMGNAEITTGQFL